ncbi:DUF1194 domain-containing protein [Rubellimicrobium roseum]|uniref:DUF1194 domain-containing protein n=1 Tax=Rubellimicrobium roseum TaxID=687525 RepID=A0A5C4NFY5_9RHOB|nr:DUF1194 domain-containing protein [Rubellimicrobium roseum]TNC72795.1 DUF1194 domain-containing protein [Rubellimicrobium roseum]
MAIRATWCLVTLLGLATSATAQGCRLALVLALDVSSSVDVHEDRLQRGGLAQALVAPEVRRAFLTGDPVALYAFEWSDETTQSSLLPSWQMVRSEDDLTRIALTIATSRRPGSSRQTALGSALAHAAGALEAAPACRAWTVDVAGDGISNNGPSPRAIYEAVPLFETVTVNALIIVTPRTRQALVSWFEAEMLHGSGAFWIEADGYEDYERAMRAKLLRELSLPMVSGLPPTGYDGP